VSTPRKRAGHHELRPSGSWIAVFEAVIRPARKLGGFAHQVELLRELSLWTTWQLISA